MKTQYQKIALPATLIFAAFMAGILSGCGDDDDEGPKRSNITITSMNPSSPATLKYYQTAAVNDRVNISYDYTIVEKDGVRIFVQPFTGGSISPGYVYTSSSLLTGTGKRDVRISVSDKNEAMVKVDQLRLVITAPDAATVIREEFVNVDFTFTE